MIDLGLGRINKLIRLLIYPFPWRAIHVAGTNGKGSVCAYISSGLTHSRLLTGRFTSPYLIDRWDCICINDRPISKSTFLAAETHVHSLNRQHGIDATEFELLTATAFEVFSRERVQVAVIEVGIGGRLDATNIFPGMDEDKREEEELQIREPLVTVITKIGMDHEGFLGKTIGEIAWQKAGIVKNGVEVVVDGSNSPEVMDVIRNYAKEVSAGQIRSVEFSKDSDAGSTDNAGKLRILTRELGEMMVKVPLHGGYQYQNALVACEALAVVSKTYSEITLDSVVKGVENAKWPGRLDWADLTPLVPDLNGEKVLLDGAHNPQAAKELAAYVDGLRDGGVGGINWVIGATRGKNIGEILRLILREGDNIFAVPFEKVDGMSWIRSIETGEIVSAAGEILGEVENTWECRSDIEGLEAAVKDAEKNHRKVVVAGSLYLVGSIFRKCREKTERLNALV